MKWLLSSYTTVLPLLVWGTAVGAYVLPARCGRRAKAVGAGVLLLVCLKFVLFERIGGHAFRPELPEALLLVADWAYYGVVALAALALPCCFGRSRVKDVVLPLAACGLSAAGLWNAVRPPAVRSVTLSFGNLPAELDGYRIAQVTDIHCSSELRRWRTQAVVDLVNAQDADLVCLLGDNEDGPVATRFEDVAPLAGLHARDGVVSVTGNHEYYNEPERWFPAYGRLGIRFLANACVFPRRTLAVGGVNDDEVSNPRHGGRFGAAPDVGAAFAAATNGEFRLLLQHRPGAAPDNFERHRVDLQLSGHTHGGYFPGAGWVVSAFNRGFLRGVYAFGDSRLCISNGAGQSAGIMMRFSAPCEIVVITLRRSSPAAAADGTR